MSADTPAGSGRNRLQHFIRTESFKNLFFILAGNVLGQGFSFLIALYIANHFGPRSFGIVNYAQVLGNYLLVISTFGLSQVLAREIIHDPEHRRENIGNALLIRGGLAGMLLIVLGVYLASSDYGKTEKTVMLLYGLNAFFLSWNLDQSYDVLKKSRYHSIIKLCGYNLMYLLLTAVAVFLMQAESYAYIVAAMVVSSFLYMTTNVAVFRKRVLHFPFRPDFSRMKRLLRQGAPLLYTSLLTVVFANVGIFILQNVHGSRATGIYAAAYRIISLFLLVDVAVSRVLMPKISALPLQAGAVRRHVLKKVVLLKASYIIPFVTLVFFFAGPIVGLLYNEAYMQSIQILRILGLWPLVLMFSPLGTFLYMSKNMGYFMLYITVQMVTALVLSLLLVPELSWTGAAYAYTCSGFLAAAVLLLLTRANLKRLDRNDQ